MPSLHDRLQMTLGDAYRLEGERVGARMFRVVVAAGVVRRRTA
jgi:hypothetical protein